MPLSFNKAILQVADTGPRESLQLMLESIGIRCMAIGRDVRIKLREVSCKSVDDPQSLIDHMGYQEASLLPSASLDDMRRPDVIFCDIKAHQNKDIVTELFPNLSGRILWYRITGGRPQFVRYKGGDHGNEISPGVPVLTPNQWYRIDPSRDQNELGGSFIPEGGDNVPVGPNWGGTAYPCWPPFYRFAEFSRIPRYHLRGVHPSNPVCLVHGIRGWGSGDLVDNVRSLGVKMHGLRAPDGVIQNVHVPNVLADALCMVHLKGSDAPGYALYEAMAGACPIVFPRLMIWAGKMDGLFIPGTTCLAFGKEQHSRTPAEAREAILQIRDFIHCLRDVNLNRRIGEDGRTQLQKVMWSPNSDDDRQSLYTFLARNFPN